MSTPHHRLVLEEFVRMRERKPGLEFDGTSVLPKVPHGGRHSRLQYKLAEYVNRFAEPLRRALAFTELRTTFEGQSRIPDVAVYLWDRIPREPDGSLADEFSSPPDITAEIVSPERSVNAVIRGALWFVEHGVQAALLVDPQDQSIIVFRADGRVLTLDTADHIDLHDVLPGFLLTVQRLFDSLNLS